MDGKMKKTKECIKCEHFFECAGKDTDNPCLHFKERQEKKNGSQFKSERRKI